MDTRDRTERAAIFILLALLTILVSLLILTLIAVAFIGPICEMA